ncbi:MAG: hypothetical protein EBE86_007155 [Hormoscilla sp. GUM202]|nr:hypothetical protein [Hormoscilla sp. GUM202]
MGSDRDDRRSPIPCDRPSDAIAPPMRSPHPMRSPLRCDRPSAVPYKQW